MGGIKLLQIERKKLEELKPYGNNAKEHTPEQVQKIADSIKQFGFKVPILVDAEGMIIAGHGRYYASKELGLDKVPVIVVNDLSESQIRAYRIMDNKVGESNWIQGLLKEELVTLQEEEVDISTLGFEEHDLKKLFKEEPLVVGNETEKLGKLTITCPNCQYVFSKKDGRKA